MPPVRSRRGSPVVFDFEGTGDEARQWLDKAYGPALQLSGPLGTLRHHRLDFGGFCVDHLTIDAEVSFGSAVLPSLVVVDVLAGCVEYTRDGVTDVASDGESVLVAAIGMPVTGRSDHFEARTTSIAAEVVAAAVAEAAPHQPAEDVRFCSFVPHSPAAGARWRATVDQLSSVLPGDAPTVDEGAAARLLGHTLLQTFPNDAATTRVDGSDSGEGSTSTVRRAARVIAEHAYDPLTMSELAELCGVTPRAMQYAFRRHLGCTPQAYRRRVRLDLVRQALRDGSALSVSDAATRYGFTNLGRFAADYRQVFDENPGSTLGRRTP